MSEPLLPDDPSQWPADPHELLGVPRDVGPRDLRRAYTRLIRLYKPEQFPEQFRRIRAAYENAVRLAEFFGGLGEPGALVTGRLDSSKKAPVANAPGSPEQSHGSTFDPAEDAQALWELAAAGHEVRAYAALVRLFRRRPEQTDLPLRLYWLLALNLDLDRERDPCAWLSDALRLGGLAGPAAELFRRELDERPAEALAAGDSLATVNAPADRLAGYLIARVAAAARLRRWDAVRLDLDRGRERIRPADDRSWLRFLLAVIDYAAWAADGSNDADQILSDCRREVAELGHLSVSESESFDRLEYLLQASAGWARLRAGTLPPELLNLLPAAWVRPFTEIRPALAGLLGEIAAAPENWLWHLDVVAARNPAALSFLGSLLGQYEVRLSAPPPVPHLPADLARLVAEMLHDAGQWVYASFRPRLLEFCLREAIGAELVAAVAPATSAGNALRQAIPADWPLRYVCWACRLAWAA